MNEPIPSHEPLPGTRISNEQAALADRVTRIESILVGAAAAVGALCLVLGELLPFLSYSQDGEPTTTSLVTFGFDALAYRDKDGSAEGSSVFIGIAFIGLLIVVVASLAALWTIGLRAGYPKSTRWVGIVATFLVIGVVGVWLTAAVGSGNGELHRGPLWLTSGALVLIVLARSRTARTLWVRPKG